MKAKRASGLDAEVTRLREENERLAEALRRITERRGPFSMDHFTHAVNTIEAMAGIAEDALARTGEMGK